jgi:hypothetical protein
MGLVEATFVGLALLAIVVVLGALLVSVAMGACMEECQPAIWDAELYWAAHKTAAQQSGAIVARTGKCATWRLVQTGTAIYMANGRGDLIRLSAQVRS